MQLHMHGSSSDTGHGAANVSFFCMKCFTWLPLFMQRCITIQISDVRDNHHYAFGYFTDYTFEL